MNCLAVCEKPVPLSVLASVCCSSRSALQASVDEAVRRQLLSVTNRGIEIGGQLIRKAVNSSVSVAEWISAHGRFAEALISLREPALSAEVASHLLEAGEALEAVPYVLRGARLAFEQGSWENARALLERALDADPPVHQNGALTALLGRVLKLHGDFARAEEVWARAERLYGTSGQVRRALECRLESVRALFFRPGRDLDVVRERVRRLKAEALDPQLMKLLAKCMELEIRIADALRPDGGGARPNRGGQKIPRCV